MKKSKVGRTVRFFKKYTEPTQEYDFKVIIARLEETGRTSGYTYFLFADLTGDHNS